MTIDEACDILNANRHRDYAEWLVRNGEAVGPELDINDPLCLTDFESVAIATAYERLATDAAREREGLTIKRGRIPFPSEPSPPLKRRSIFYRMLVGGPEWQ